MSGFLPKKDYSILKWIRPNGQPMEVNLRGETVPAIIEALHGAEDYTLTGKQIRHKLGRESYPNFRIMSAFKHSKNTKKVGQDLILHKSNSHTYKLNISTLKK